MFEGNLARKIEDDFSEQEKPKESARVYHLNDLLEKPVPEEEVQRINKLRESYMDEQNLNSPINMIKKALAFGNRNSAEEIRERTLTDLETEMLFIKDDVDERIDLEKKKLSAVVEYYKQLF